MLRALFVVATSFTLLFTGSTTSRADVVVPGQKKVRRDVIVDFGSYADSATGSHLVKSGDTVSALAKKHLGSVTRQNEILELNPGLTAASLKAGATILIPPRTADSSKSWSFFAIGWGHHVVRAFHGQQLYHHHYSTELWAVPQSKVAEFLKRLQTKPNKKRDAMAALAKESWIAKAPEKLTGYASLSEGSPIASIVETYRVEKIDKGKILLKKTAAQNLNKDKKPLAGAALYLTPWNGLLLLLTGCGAAGLGFLARRRRSTTPPRLVEA